MNELKINYELFLNRQSEFHLGGLQVALQVCKHPAAIAKWSPEQKLSLTENYCLDKELEWKQT